MTNGQPVCVYCRRHPIDPAWRPFCSERCRMADLGRWLGDEYRVTGSDPHGDGPGASRAVGPDERPERTS